VTPLSFRSALRGAALALILLAADAALLWWGIACGWSAAAMAGAHFAIVGATGLAIVRSPWAADRHAVLLLVATGALGPLGPAGVLFAMALEGVHARNALSLEEWHQNLFPPANGDGHVDLWRRIGQRASDQGANARVTPFLDVLAFGSVQQRQAVVGIIAQQFRPAFAGALKAALRDEHNVVRVQAATVIARLEQDFLDRTFELEAAVKQAPADANTILALASHCDEQAFAGLLDPTREQQCQAQAADGYARYLELRPEDHAVDLRLARLQLRRGHFDQAEPRLQRLAAAGHESARLWLMETLFALRRYEDLRGVASQFDDMPAEALPAEAAAAIELWAGHEVSA